MNHNDPQAKLIMAGVRSTALASHVLALAELVRPHQPEMAEVVVSMAKAVLRDWGIDAGEASPVTTPANDEPTLIWPPPSSALPDVYRENYYHARKEMRALALDEGDSPCVVGPDEELAFTGFARAHQDGGWLMRFSHREHTFWLHHRDVQPGDEIPKGYDGQG